MAKLPRLAAVFAFSLAPLFPLSAQQSVTDSIPLPEDYFEGLRAILERAGSQAPDLRQVGLDRLIADEGLRIARSRYYPSVGIGGNFGFRYEDRSGEAEDYEALNANASLGLNRPLYFWGAVEADVNIGEIDYENSLISTRQSFQRVIGTLRSIYLDLVLNEMRLRNARLRRTILEQDISTRRSAFENGRMSEEDFLTFQIDLEDSLLEIEELELRKERIMENFRRLSGVTGDFDVPVRIDALDLEALEETFSGDFLSPQWIEDTFTMQYASNNIEKEDRNRIIVRSRQTPNLSFSASVSQRPVNTANENDVNTISYFAGISLSWNIFDGFATQASKRISFLRSRKLEFEMRDQAAQLREEEIKIREEVLIAIRKQKLLESRLDLAAQNYQRAVSEHELGRSSAKDLRAAQLEFYNRELQVHERRSNLMVMLTEYLGLINRDRGLQYLRFENSAGN